jgi:hypothetical protein
MLARAILAKILVEGAANEIDLTDWTHSGIHSLWKDNARATVSRGAGVSTGDESG